MAIGIQDRFLHLFLPAGKGTEMIPYIYPFIRHPQLQQAMICIPIGNTIAEPTTETGFHLQKTMCRRQFQKADPQQKWQIQRYSIAPAAHEPFNESSALRRQSPSPLQEAYIPHFSSEYVMEQSFVAYSAATCQTFRQGVKIELYPGVLSLP